MSEKRLPGHREIAAACGFSTATVSRALAGHPGVRESTKQAVQRAARALGYQTDPRMAALSQRRWQSGRSSGTVKILVLVDSFTFSEKNAPKFAVLNEAATGYGYELEYLVAEKVIGLGARITRELVSRGIRGILVNVHRTDVLPDLAWNEFCVVMVGEEHPDLPFHRVGTNWRQGFDLVTAEMRRVGCSVGFCIVRYGVEQGVIGTELNRLVLSEALLHREEFSAAGYGDAPLFRFDTEESGVEQRFRSWKEQHNIDVCLCNNLEPHYWLENMGSEIRNQTKLYAFPLSQEAAILGIPGCDLNLGTRISEGLRLLHQSLLLDDRGHSKVPKTVLIPVSAIGF